MANKEILDFPLLTALTGAKIYGVKNDTDYNINVGTADGLATLDVTGKLTATQVPTNITVTWGSITGTLSSQTDLTTALNGKAATVHTHAGSDITSGTVAPARLGTGTTDTTTFLRGDGTWAIPSVPAGSVAWGAITGTLSAQTDLQTALNGKASSTHTHAAADITSGTMAAARLGSGTANSSTFLRGDGVWASPATGSGTVTSVNVSGGTTGLSFSGGPVTSSGTITMAGTLDVGSGGTGATTAAAARTNLGAAASAHSHAISDVSNLQSSLDAKANLSGATFTGGVTATSFTVSSDRRLKSDIMDLVDNDFVIERLRPVSYTLNSTEKSTYGFIAQEVEELIPEAVVDNGTFKSIDYAPIMAFLVAKVQELAARVEELEAR